METPLQYKKAEWYKKELDLVTILVLVETPLQCDGKTHIRPPKGCHNPCFSGNSFAIV